jgi:hypothetical protein
LNCTNCGAELDPRRVELGYDYCTGAECQQRHMRRVTLARVGVNKASDQFVRADSVLPADPPPAPVRPVDDGDEPDDAEGAPPPVARRSPRGGGRRPSTAERTRAAEAALDDRLERSYRRFCAGEISAAEMDRQRNALIDAFNARLLTQGVRYRHLLRRRF